MEINLWVATVYGLIQGLAEFLPVSSSGHLAILPKVLGIDDPGVAFDLAMHLGTGLAVLVYFWRDIKNMLVDLWAIKNGRLGPMGFFALNIVLGNISTLVVALAFQDMAETSARTPVIIAINLMVFGLFMWLSDRWSSRERKEETFSGRLAWKESLLMGLFQGIAVFPGVSRSGATLGIARLLKIDRPTAGRFSFMMSLPVIFGGMLLHLKHLPSAVSLAPIVWGIVVSFVAGVCAIHFFLYWVSKQGLWPFTLYRFVLATFLLLLF